MTNRKQKLELTWIGKENRPRLEPRILLEEPGRSYHASHRVSEDDLFDNRLIFGDNLLALKALEQEFAGKVKCVYIDPPFNTGEAFEHYDDGLEHSIWLSLMRDRVQILHNLLSNEGTLFVHIDDNELGYIIPVLDEIFQRGNRKYIVTFKQSSVSGPKSINPGLVSIASYVLIYAKDSSNWNPHKVYVSTKRDKRYSKYIANFDALHRDWKLITLREALASSVGIKVSDLTKRFQRKDELEIAFEKLVLSDPHRVVRTARVQPRDISESCRPALISSQAQPGVVFKGERDGRDDLYFLNGEQLIFYSAKTKELDGTWITGQAASTLWDDLLSNNLHNEGGVRFPKGKKPESLIKRVLEMSTNSGDWVLDSFSGSGTTGAVAHKMGRRWILVELGEHCHTHIIPRMKSVIDGDDTSGVTKAVDWQGGGGFRYYRLAPSLLETDRWGNWVINKAYNAEMLAAAACKLEGFTYAPSDLHYWQHGHSTEQDFLYVTTQTLTHEQLQLLSEEVGTERSLLVLCGAWRGVAEDAYPNLTIKKIPAAVLHRCEYGHDDYSLRVENLPAAPPVALSPSRPVGAGEAEGGDDPLHQLGLFQGKA